MGERGPQGKPTLLKLIAGNPGKRDLSVNEPVPAAMEDVHPPKELAPESVAAEIWRRLVPDLSACGLARSVDWTLLVRYCMKFERWLYLGDEIKRIAAENPSSKGTTYPIMDSKGRIRYVAEFPWVAEWRTLDRELRLDERALGISPSARSRISVPTVARESEADLRRDFFRRAPNYGGA